MAAPSRTMPRTGVTLLARWYYDVWEALPTVRSGLFGRGVLAVSRDGARRVAALPEMMADDLVLSEAFAPAERVVVHDVAVVVHPARTLRDLVRRRARVTTGNVQADRAGLRGAEARTSLGDLWQVVRERPGWRQGSRVPRRRARRAAARPRGGARGRLHHVGAGRELAGLMRSAGQLPAQGTIEFRCRALDRVARSCRHGRPSPCAPATR